MARQYQAPGGAYANESGTRQYMLPDGTFVNETVGGGGGATINLTGANCTQDATSGAGAVSVTPAGGGTENLTGANCTQTATIGAGAVTVVPPSGTITTDEIRNYSNILQTAVTVPIVAILTMGGSVALLLTNQVTNGAGKLVITNAALTVGTAYMLATWDATDTNADTMKRGLKKYTAA